MMNFVKAYIRVVDTMNYRIGRVMMYSLLGMFAALLW